MTKRALILQNYHTPYRHALFEALAERDVDLTVAYMHRPEDEGRRWDKPPTTTYRAIDLPHRHFGAFILFWIPRRLRTRVDVAIVLDNNPTNLAMIVWAVWLRLCVARQLVWVEHIPDSYKGRLKTLYQNACSRCLAVLSDGVIAFSEMSRRYLADLEIAKPIHRMVQATPAGVHTARSGALRRFGYLGSNQERKNVANLIAAFGQLPQQDAELHIAGFDASFADPRIHPHGYVDGEAREAFFRSIDVLVLPSLADPWGLVVNEAVDRGCLAIVSDHCGSCELVRQIDAALVCGVEVEDLRIAMTRCMDADPEAVIRLRSRAAEVIAGFSIAAAADRMAMAIDGN